MEEVSGQKKDSKERKKERINFSMLLENSYHIAHKYISIKEWTANDPIRDTKRCPKILET